VILRDFVIANRAAAFPNPFDDLIYASLGDKVVKNATVVYKQTFTNQFGIVRLNLATLKLGVYILKVLADDQLLTFKMTKK